MTDKSAAGSPRKRSDGRKSLLVYMDEDLIKTLKKIAVDRDANVYDLVEEATREWIENGRRRKAK